MKKILSILIVLLIANYTILAQNKEIKNKIAENTYTALPYTKILTSNVLPASEILDIIKKPLFAYNATKNQYYSIASFYFTYIERDIYYGEDDKPFIGTEKYGIASLKSVVPEMWYELLAEKLKSGDTVIFDNLKFIPDLKKSDSILYTTPLTLIVK